MVELLAGLAVLLVGAFLGYHVRRLEAHLAEVSNASLRRAVVDEIQLSLGKAQLKLNAHEKDLSTIANEMKLKRED